MSRVIILLVVLSTFIFPDSYRLDQILTLAESHNASIKLARADLKTASAERLTAISGALPTIDVDAGYNRNLQENIFFFEADGMSGSFKTSFTNEFRANAVLRQTLFSFEVGFALKAASHFSRFTKQRFEAVRQEVAKDIKTAFYRSLLLAEVANVAAGSEKSALDNYENLKLRYEGGMISEFTLLQAEVRYLNSIPATIRARQELQQSVNALKVMAGIPVQEELVLEGSLDRFPESPQDQTIGQILAGRPDYQALLSQEHLYSTNVAIQRAGYYPTLEGSFSYAYTAASDQFRLDLENDNYALGLNLKIPLFSGGLTRANVRRAQADVMRINAQIVAANNSIQVALDDIRLRLQEARERIQASQKAVATARRAYDIAETRMANGLSTQVELKDSRVELDQAQVNYYRAIFDYLSAYFDWQYAVGADGYRG